MNKLIVIILLFISSICQATPLQKNLQHIEHDWAIAYYGTAKAKQETAYIQLMTQTEQLLQQYPNNSEVLFYLAMIKASMAEHEGAMNALEQVTEARDLLNKVIELNPKTMNGSAYVILGTLYYRVPAWPIAFGDNQLAEKMFQTALTINPNGIDSNYFYGKFLLANDKTAEAKQHFEKALAAPIRTEQTYSDEQLKAETKRVLQSLEL
ncbi:MAG: TRAP transporter TatT component family protein [Methylococcaceae bacterium]